MPRRRESQPASQTSLGWCEKNIEKCSPKCLLVRKSPFSLAWRPLLLLSPSLSVCLSPLLTATCKFQSSRPLPLPLSPSSHCPLGRQLGRPHERNRNCNHNHRRRHYLPATSFLSMVNLTSAWMQPRTEHETIGRHTRSVSRQFVAIWGPLA